MIPEILKPNLVIGGVLAFCWFVLWATRDRRE